MHKARSLLVPIVALSLSLSLFACGKKDGASADSASPKGAGSAAAPLPTADLKSALSAVPADAVGVVSIAFPMNISEMSTGFGFLPFDPAIAKEMQVALIEHSKTHLGIDASQVRSLVVFASGVAEPQGAVIVSPVEGELKGTTVMHEDVKLVVIDAADELAATQFGKTLIVGKLESVKQALAGLKGGDSLAKSDSAFAKQAQEQVLSSYFSVTADATKLPLPKIPMTEGLSHAGLRFAGDGLHLAIHGKKESLEMLSTTAMGALQMAISLAKKNMEESKDSFGEGSAGIMGYYTAKNFGTMLEPTITGDQLTLDFPFDGGASSPMIFVAVTGILAAVAIPAFMKYIKKSKTSEASQLLRKLSDGARVLAAQGQPLPASVGPTPPLGSCCQNGEKCAPESELWEHPSWLALDFAMRDPHYYSYEFVNTGSGYAAKAYGDLDCDGVYSTFTIPSAGGSDDRPTLYRESELE